MDEEAFNMSVRKFLKQLGIKDQPTSLAFEIRMDFVLEDGRVLWEGTTA